MLDTGIARARKFLSTPGEAFRESRDDTEKTVSHYFSTLLLIFAVLSVVFAAIVGSFTHVLPGTSFVSGAGAMVLASIISIISIFIAGTVFTLLFSVWVHLWVWILGGRNGLAQTVKAIVYGMTPFFVYGWIPWIGFFFSIWSLVLDVHGIRELGSLSTRKAALAIIIPVVILLIVAATVFFYYLVPWSVHQFMLSRS
ncbi:MAG: Yip1 family protein [Methanoregula sp.]|uniref:Yip1 family protein n=1 Tax=Methanoregula sp. TaxID=2052170 RepID=UPI003BB13113